MQDGRCAYLLTIYISDEGQLPLLLPYSCTHNAGRSLNTGTLNTAGMKLYARVSSRRRAMGIMCKKSFFLLEVARKRSCP